MCLDVLSAEDVVGESFLSMSLDLLRGTRLVVAVEEVVTSSLLKREIKRVAWISLRLQYCDSLFKDGKK